MITFEEIKEEIDVRLWLTEWRFDLAISKLQPQRPPKPLQQVLKEAADAMTKLAIALDSPSKTKELDNE